MKLIQNARVISPGIDLPEANIVINDGEIISITEKEVNAENFDEVIDAYGMMAMPGFIDIHTHGAAGYDTCDGGTEAIRTFAKAKVAEGVTTLYPTTLTEPYEVLEGAMKGVAGYRETEEYCEIPGVHIEGPYINVDWKGAQNPDYVRDPDVEEIKKLHEIAPVGIVSLAPEAKNAPEFIRAMAEMGITTSGAHSGATYKDFLESKEAGMTHLTHFFNQMSPLHHRELGLVGSGLTDQDIKLELICDKIHVIPDMIQLVFNAKRVDQILLITDSMRASGLPDGNFKLGELEVNVKDGEARLLSGNLAGSTLKMNHGLRNVYEITGLPLSELVKISSWNQVESMNLGKLGKIEKGYRANIVLMDKDFEVQMTLVKGKKVYGV